MRVFAFVCVLILALPGVAEPSVSVRTEHEQVTVGGVKYRLVTGRSPYVVVLKRDDKARPRRVIVDVVRLGPKTRKLRGATPLVARMNTGRRQILPTRPRLVPSRRVQEHDWISSFPVRYRLKLPRSESVSLRIGLRKPKAKGRVGIAVRFETSGDQLAPLSGPIAARVIESKPRPLRKPKPKPKPKPEPDPPIIVAVIDAGPTPNEPTGPGPTEPAQIDAGPPPPVEPPPDPPARIRIVVDNQLTGPFRYVEHRVTINETLVADKEANKLEDQALIFEGELEPGLHTLSATMAWEGEAGMFFPYLREYAFVVDAEEEVSVQSGERIEVRLVGYKAGGFFTDMLEQPAARLEIKRSP